MTTISATGCCNRGAGRRAAGGFTLIELLVVLVLIGIIITFATLSIGDNGRAEAARRETRRMAALMQLLGQQAVLQSREYAVEFDADSYRFLVFDEDKHAWEPLTGDLTFRRRTLPKGMSVTVQLENQPPELGGDGGSASRARHKPMVYLLSSGEMTPFELTLSAGGDPPVRYRLTGSLVGKLHWKQATG